MAGMRAGAGDFHGAWETVRGRDTITDGPSKKTLGFTMFTLYTNSIWLLMLSHVFVLS